jgi:hypothetical protein
MGENMTDDFDQKLKRIAEHFGSTVPNILDWLQTESTRRGVPVDCVLGQFLELVEASR